MKSRTRKLNPQTIGDLITIECSRDNSVMNVEIYPQLILITANVAGERLKQKYIGYSVTEAKKKFKQLMKETQRTALINQP